MKKKRYDYTICPDNSTAVFKDACEKIEESFPGVAKDQLLIDVDGSTIQIYGEDSSEIIVYDDYDIGAVYVRSDIDLSELFGEKTAA